MEFKDQSEYYGSWLNGLRQGYGKFFLPDKTEITGIWENDLPVKDIEIKYNNKNIYKGEVKNF